MNTQIKGYFYDPVTKKYFKIDKEHAAAFRTASEAVTPAETKTAHLRKRTQNSNFPKRYHQNLKPQQQQQKRIRQTNTNVLSMLDKVVLTGGYPRHTWDLLEYFPERHKQASGIQIQSALPLLGIPFQHIATTAVPQDKSILLVCAPKSGPCLDVWNIGLKNGSILTDKYTSTCYGVGEVGKPYTFTSLNWVTWDKPCLAFSTLGTETTQGSIEIYEVNSANTHIRKRTDYKTANKKSSLWTCEWTRDCKRAALGCSSGKSILVDFESTKSDIIFNDRKYLQKRAKMVPTSDVMSLAFDPESGDRGILLGRRNGSVHYVDTRENVQDYRPRTNLCAGSVSCLKYRSSQFLASSTVGSLQLFDSRMWKAIGTIVEPLNTVFTPPKFSVSDDGNYVLWSVKSVEKSVQMPLASFIQGSTQKELFKFCCWRISDGKLIFSHEFEGSELAAVSWITNDGIPTALCTNNESRSVELYSW